MQNADYRRPDKHCFKEGWNYAIRSPPFHI